MIARMIMQTMLAKRLPR
jgi:hypothetical protein